METATWHSKCLGEMYFLKVNGARELPVLDSPSVASQLGERKQNKQISLHAERFAQRSHKKDPGLDACPYCHIASLALDLARRAPWSPLKLFALGTGQHMLGCNGPKQGSKPYGNV